MEKNSSQVLDNKQKKSILIVDDEPEIIEFLEFELSEEFKVITAPDGMEGVKAARSKAPDLILLDITMPVMDGLEACKQLKADLRTRSIPILILSARTELQYLLDAFEFGVEDYIEKPFRSPELKARIKSKLRHSHLPPAAKPIQFGNLILNMETLGATVSGRAVAFSKTEFRLVHFLVESFGRVVTRAEIIKKVWAKKSVSERTVDIYLVKIRKKLENFDHEIAMLYGSGYVLRPNDSRKRSKL